MKFKFSKNLEYQLEAINSVMEIFDTAKNLKLGSGENNEESIWKMQSEKIIANELEINKSKILENLKRIRKENGIKKDEEDDGVSPETLQGMDFSIEMETGTGKTYVYLRTILELNKKYNLKKFIILVPSVAIREGVLKTIEQTKDHFKEIYNTAFSYFAYDSAKLNKVRDFSQSNNIEIMIMTIQAFNSDNKVMKDTPDRFHGERPIDIVANTNPVVIMDEPQNMESELSISAIKELNPLFKLRYSATHKNPINLIYRLSPIDAYNKGLVKKIQVFGIENNNNFLKVKSIEIEKKRLFAEVIIEKKNLDGSFSNIKAKLNNGDDIFYKSGKNEKYENLFVSEINKKDNYIELSNGDRYELLKEENLESIFRAQISETIKAHFNKQKAVGDKVKILSLFFIDKVDNYVNDDSMIRKIFEEEFEIYKRHYDYFKNKDVKKVHRGYFASKTVKGNIEYKDTKGDSKDDKEAYDLIMKNKEQLLSFEEPVSFIFSHSALKEGWDNPNIFQICTLRNTNSEMKKRQEIGRGLRLPLDIEGNRIYDTDVNVLSVIANESYEEYVANLQSEFSESGWNGPIPEPTDPRKRKTVKTTRYLNDEEFLKLWKKINQKTIYKLEIDSEKIIDDSVKEINENLNVNTLSISIEKVQIYFDENNKVKTTFIPDISESVARLPQKEINIENIINRISKDTNLTKNTIFEILNSINNLELIFINPEEFIRSVSIIINSKKSDLITNESVIYTPTKEVWELSLFKEFDTYLTVLVESKKSSSGLVESEKSPFEYIEYDSTGEREFAESLERSNNVKVYTKLPRGFCVDTPIGEYRPDWAIVWNTLEGDKLYLVRETKFGSDNQNKNEIFSNLRQDEKLKILFGQKHFESIGADFDLTTKKDLSDLK